MSNETKRCEHVAVSVGFHQDICHYCGVSLTATIWQVTDLATDKVFFTTRDSQAEHWNNDEQFEVTPSPSRRPVDGYHMWCLNSDVDKHSLKLGMENEAKEA